MTATPRRPHYGAGMLRLLPLCLLGVGCTPDDPDVSQPTPTSSATSGESGPTGDTAVQTDSTHALVLGDSVDFSDPGGLRDSHAVGTALGAGFLVGWTAEIPMGGTKSVALRLTGPELLDIQNPGPSALEVEGPSMVPVADGVAVAMTDIYQGRAGVRLVTTAGELMPIRWFDGAEAPRMPFASDIAAAPDGSTWTLWSETLWTLNMDQEDMAQAPTGRFRLAQQDPADPLSDDVQVLWETAPGGKHPPDVEVLPDGSVVCAVSEREEVGLPAQVVLRRLSDDGRTPVSSLDADGSRPQMAVDAAGRLAVVWREGLITDLHAYISLYDEDLNLIGGPLPLSPGWTSDRPTVAPHPEGWLVAWERPDPVDSDWTGHRELQVRLLAADGTRWLTPVTPFDSDDRRRRPAFARNGEHTLLLFEQGPNDDTIVRGATVDVTARP